MPTWKPPSQKRGDEIFGKKDRDRASCIQLHMSFEEICTVAYYDKKFLENLKANTPWTKSYHEPKPLPKTASGTLMMYQYTPIYTLNPDIEK